MSKKYVISDHHFGHTNILNFLDEDGKLIRPFCSVEYMDAHLIAAHNSVVSDQDTVYFLGDVAIKKSALKYLNAMNGRKILIKGNHDIFDLKSYVPFFDDIRAYKVYNNVILSHIPIHPDSKARFKKNLHGHVHTKSLNDPFYVNCCVEVFNYTPQDLDLLIFERSGA